MKTTHGQERKEEREAGRGFKVRLQEVFWSLEAREPAERERLKIQEKAGDSGTVTESLYSRGYRAQSW